MFKNKKKVSDKDLWKIFMNKFEDFCWENNVDLISFERSFIPINFGEGDNSFAFKVEIKGRKSDFLDVESEEKYDG